jgi:hypothetical protein
MENYYGVGPFVYCDEDPIRIIDPFGQELRIDQEYRDVFLNDLRNVFGDKVAMFSFW